MFKQILLSSIFIVSTLLSSQDPGNGTVSSRDLLSNDIKKAAKFYTTLFGWQSVQNGQYIELQKDNIHLANLVQIDPQKQSQWMPQFFHKDLAFAKTQIIRNGGLILKEVTHSESEENYLLIKDKQGAFSVLSDADVLKSQHQFPALNEWLWEELWSHEVSDSENFYTRLFEYKTEKEDSGYIIFTKEAEWIAGLLNNPFEKSQTQWVSTIRVNDPKAISAQAIALGGKVLVSVEENKGHRDAALIADPTGAVFIIEKYEEKGQ